MAKDIWFISDTHFSHANILTFRDSEGKLFRGDLFKNADEMNEVMIGRWNERVKPQDKIYHLGDVMCGANNLDPVMCRLNGHKRLLVGNHDDIGGSRDYLKWFERIGVWRIFKEHKFVCTHIPISQSNFRHKCVVNVHGHIHQNDAENNNFINICVEKTGYKPIHYDEIVQIIKNRGFYS